MRFHHFCKSLFAVSFVTIILWIIGFSEWNLLIPINVQFVVPEFEYERPRYRPIDDLEEEVLRKDPEPGTWTVDYSGAESFPLSPRQYHEAVQRAFELQHKYSGRHIHMDFWKPDESYYDIPHEENPDICESSITYLLGDEMTDFAHQLSGLFMSAGLAKATNKTFHILERNWAWGHWTDYFHEYKPNCRVPANELVAYPQHTRHWVITERTWNTVSNHNFRNTYENAHEKGILRQNATFQMMVDGIGLLFHLNDDVQNLYQSQLTKIASQVGQQFIGLQGCTGENVVIQSLIRSCPSIEVYAQQVSSTWSRFFPEKANPLVVVMSDGDDFKPLLKNSSVTAVQIFGRQKSIKSIHNRVKYAKNMLVGFSIIKEGQAVICGSTSHTCRLIAAMMGWQRAVLENRWISLETFGWRVPDYID